MSNSRNFWVQYDPESGKIIRISPRLIKDTDIYSVLESDSDICADIVSRNKSMRKHLVLYDRINEQWIVTEKPTLSDIETFKTVKITEVNNNANSTMKIIVDKTSSIMIITLDKVKLGKQFNVTDLNNVDTDMLNVYVTKYKSPDNLIATIKPDLDALLRNGIVYIDTKLDVYWDNISMYVPHLLDGYSSTILEKRITAGNANTNLTTVVEDNADFKLINIGNRKIRFTLGHVDNVHAIASNKNLTFLVSKNNPDHVIGIIEVPVVDLFCNKPVDIDISFDIPEDPCIIFKNMNHTVQYIGVQDANKY